MNLTISTADLSAEIQKHNAIVDKRNTIPALQCISFRADENTITLESNNLERGMRSCLNADVETPGHILIPSDTFTKILQDLPEPTTTLAVDDLRLTITSGASVFTLSVLPPQDFPEVHTTATQPICHLTGEQLHALLDPTLFAVSKDESRYVLQGTLWEFSETEIKSIATDGHRLQASKVAVPAKSPMSVIIPGDSGTIIVKYFGGTESLAVSFNDNFMSVSAGQRTFLTRLIDGQFPDYRQVIPEKGQETLTIKIHRPTLLSALKRVSLLTGESRMVKMSAASNILTLSAKNAEMGSAVEDIVCECPGSGVITGYNASYMMQMLSAMSGEMVVWQTDNALTPAKFFNPDALSVVSVVMPMRI